MTGIVKPGAGVLFMKIGTHAQEPLEAIIDRKLKEISDAGYALWGYGGNTCHPLSMVQPFAEEFAGSGQPIMLCMQEMNSRHIADPLRANEFSVDSQTWQPIPPEINVKGSRFALKIKGLRREEHVLPLNQTRVAVGPSRGRLGSRYIIGQVDKACLEIADEPEIGNEEPKVLKIDVVAELESPYAVFVRE